MTLSRTIMHKKRHQTQLGVQHVTQHKPPTTVGSLGHSPPSLYDGGAGLEPRG